MTSWIGPSPYFGLYFGAEGEAQPGAIAMVATGSGSMTGTLEGVQDDQRSGAGGLTPWTREQWEAFRSEQQPEPVAAQQAGEPVRGTRPVSGNVAALLTSISTPAPVPVQVEAPQVVIVQDPGITMSEAELAAVAALVLSARANAYRRAFTGMNQLGRAA